MKGGDRMDTSPTVVVGGGPAGALTAVALTRQTDRAVVVVDPSRVLGPGSAYATREPHHLLNSRARQMSVLPSAPDDFVDWARCGPDNFVPRATFGAYVTARLGPVAHVGHPAVRVRPAGARWHVDLADGTTRRASAVVLAVGHAPPAFPSAAAAGVRLASGYVPVPWQPGALDAIPPQARVLLLGTGLTAVDAVLSLLARGHTGRIVAVSRHGLLPLAHTDCPSPPAAAPTALTLRGLLRELRAAAAEGDWRCQIDALRLRADRIWHHFTPEEQRRFLRHVLRYWEIHRHRCAPEVARTIEATRASGQLSVRKARVTAIEPAPSGFTVALTASSTETRPFDAVVNCTGPGHPAGIPLVRQLAADGLARADSLGLGIEVDDEGRLVARDGHPTEGLYAIGSLRRGRWWETTAIPEIRTQAYTLAARLSHSSDPALAHPTAA